MRFFWRSASPDTGRKTSPPSPRPTRNCPPIRRSRLRLTRFATRRTDGSRKLRPSKRRRRRTGRRTTQRRSPRSKSAQRKPPDKPTHSVAECKPEVKTEVKPEVKAEVKPEVKKKKVIKKVIRYVETDSDDDDEEIIVKKEKKKPEPIQQPVQQLQPEKSYNDLLCESSLERMQNKIMNERAKHLISHIIPNYY